MSSDVVQCRASGGQHEYEIETLHSGKFRISWCIPWAYCLLLHGPRWIYLRRIEQETGCHIQIPPRGVTGDTVVTSLSRSNVCAARRRLEQFVKQESHRIAPTHFISVPFNTPGIMENFNCFKQRVLSKYGHCRGVTEAIFKDPGRLHHRIGVIAIANDQEQEAAVEALRRAVAHAASLHTDGVMRIRMQGLHFMNSTPAGVTVLYARLKMCSGASASEGAPEGVTESAAWVEWRAKVSTDDGGCRTAPKSVQHFGGSIVDYMNNAGVMNYRRNWKVSSKVLCIVSLLDTHTLMSHDDSDAIRSWHHSGLQHQTESPPVETFDARGILQEFSDFDFGVLEVRDVHLSVIRSTNPSTGYFSDTAVIPLQAKPPTAVPSAPSAAVTSALTNAVASASPTAVASSPSSPSTSVTSASSTAVASAPSTAVTSAPSTAVTSA